MNVYPLTSLTVEEAAQLQFRLVDEVTKVFTGTEILTRGDLGVIQGLNQPITTKKVEQVLANFFNCEAAMLVRGAGTSAIRQALHATIGTGGTMLVHKAPIYPTTKTSIEMMGIQTKAVDFNDSDTVKSAVSAGGLDGILIQVTRQKPDDSYDLKELITVIRAVDKEIPIITDDNYSTLKTSAIGAQIGGTLACFSTFKLLGPEGIGCIVGEKQYIDGLRKENYSGGSQVQGHESIAVLQGMIYAPVALALSAKVSEEVCQRLNNGEISGVDKAFIVNAQSKVVIVKLKQPIAKAVLAAAEKLGAAPNPVGAESKYEFVPMFYRISGTFRAADPQAEEQMMRINPMRAGADTILRILQQAMAEK
ncbi:PLP-dependent transferase [Enterococcus sp. BWB1-3]|uniref:aminotransferase class I/II-fold pyridoxal phosphate-dependent enzyme n=1 Tax=Enterococcus sp. BWB1-3 TaxID=2787713 RepID=UPI001923A23F|nr:aminotransferase class I/II-fold pyridoxal phosphate-dependent enzyme [Enterococcus sp. BWB1-3]MBL1227939.1 PLP-dependent transferase [Enterococcus sp. BWB1-3]